MADCKEWFNNVVAEYDDLYFSHIRGEGASVLEAVKEVVEITEKSGSIGGHIGHHKVTGRPYWGKSSETLQVMEETNARGIRITCDQCPYNRGILQMGSNLVEPSIYCIQ